jgi:carboxyl-terminal processing protease
VVLTELDAAINSMRGAPGTTVALRVKRDGKPIDFSVTRSQVELPSVASQLLAPGFGFMRITSFTDVTAPEFVAAFAKLQVGQPQLKGLIIDLRNNPGGVLDAAVAIADDLLDAGTIVSAQGRTADARFVSQATPGDIAQGAEIALLVNGGSASAAEILAAALHDNGRATLIGRKTYGKGSVQTIMPLSGGQALKLTTSRYFTPAGASINRRGIVPDIEINGTEQPPAELDADNKPSTLASRDQAVAIALQMLRTKVRLAAGNAPTRPRS